MSISPRVYSIAPGIPFVDALAQGMLARLGKESPRDPLALARATVLLPTRRAVRALREAFLRATGGTPLLLPRMMPLGDLDEDELFIAGEPGSGLTPEGGDLPPVIGGMRRQMLLARLVLRFGDARWREADPAQAVELAAELARLLDHMETENVGFDRLAALRPEDENLARHWDEILAFLKILTQHWPDVLAEEGAIGPADRRNRVLAAQAECWRASPPDGWVIAAGSTGSIPATAELLITVAKLERGCVVLPGLDDEMAEPEWAEVAGIDTHAQSGLARLIAQFGITRSAVKTWGEEWPSAGAGIGHPDRTRLLAAAICPQPQRALAEAEAALDGVSWIESPAPAEEAGAIALIMRETLNHDGRTAALVTPDRGLARRVAARLKRWGIEVDDSAGTPLAATPVAAFLRLVAEMVASGFDAVTLLACLKHPLACGGMTRETFRARVRDLDCLVLRGPSGAPGVRSLRARSDARSREYAARGKAGFAARTRALIPWLDRVEECAAPLVEVLARGRRPCADLARAHVAVAEALAADDVTAGADRLWRGEEAEAVAGFFADLTDAADGFPPISGTRYPELLAALLAGRVVRPRFGRHPRLNIWGPLEARLQHADVIVLAGLNEGTWPPDPGMDPWMSRPMRAAVGLSLPERRIGLAAHDFAQAFAAPRVVLSRSQRVGGQPTVPSRWLLRLANTLEDKTVARLKASGAQWLDRAARLDRDRAAVVPQRPLPCPPLPLRPRRLSVTEISTLQVNPYGVYARHVLGLDPLESIAADPGAAERGNFVHDVMEKFFKRFPAGVPAGGTEEFRTALEEIGRECLVPVGIAPGLHAIWWPRFRDIARWVATQEVARRAVTRQLAAECSGQLRIEVPGGDFLLRGRADRIDRLADGRLAIVDYKTGTLPQPGDDKSGFAPQLPLLAAMAEAGAFAGLRPMAVGELAYWKLSGGEEGGSEKPFARDKDVTVEDAVRAALDGLIGLIRVFDDPTTPYAPYVYPARVRFDDYAHLARVTEWSGDSAGGAEEAE
ncbi:MAG: double-strand break repair protein AddB [Alphaproteobacteria bacterium]